MSIVKMTPEQAKKKFKITPDMLSKNKGRAYKLTADDLKDFPDMTPGLAGAARRPGRPKSPSPRVGTYIRLEASTLEKLRARGRRWQTSFANKVSELVRKGVL
ncbi:MAG: BrnA antitoxin family protein [Rickettsiales bacterium]|jgi:uncharacterized protein (DUF4415 family)|nr:BrnA antitoxin family protein [Rickettsiales bacterium]